MEFNREQFKEARRARELYEKEIESLYQDYAFELELKLGLHEGQGEKLLDEC